MNIKDELEYKLKKLDTLLYHLENDVKTIRKMIAQHGNKSLINSLGEFQNMPTIDSLCAEIALLQRLLKEKE